MNPEAKAKREKARQEIREQQIADALKLMSEKLDLAKGDPGKTPVFGIDFLRQREMEEIMNMLTPEYGVDYMTDTEVARFLEKATPKKGKDYFDGEQGEPGRPGEPGKSLTWDMLTKEQKDSLRGNMGPMGAMPRHQWIGTKLRFEKSPNVWGELVDLVGQPGSSIQVGDGEFHARQFSGATRFIELADVSREFTQADALKVVRVNATGTALEYAVVSGGGGLNSFTSPDDSLVIGGTLTDPTAEINYAHAGTWTAEQSNTSIFLNNSDIDWSAGAGNDIVIAAGGNAGGNWLGFLWDSTNSVVKLQDLSGNLYDFQVDTLTANDAIVATTISATTGVYSTLRATGSGGLLFESNSGTDVALFGAGGGAGATFYGGVNIDGNLAVDTNVLFVDTSLNQVIIGATSGSSKLSVVTNSIGASPSTTSGLSLENTTAASAGSQQVSPSILLRSKGWGTTLGSSQSVDWQSYSLPVQGTAPTGRMIWASSINGGAYTEHMNLSTLGNLNVGYNGRTDFGSRGTFINASGVNGKILTLGRDNANYMWHLGISATSYFSVYDNDGTTVRLTIAPTTGFTGIGLGTTGATSMLHIKASGSTSATSAFRIWNAGSADRLVYRDDGRLWLGTGTVSYNELLTLNTSGTQVGIQFTTTASGVTSTSGAYLMYTDSVGMRYLNFSNKPHVFYINGSEVARFSETGAIMQVTGTLAAQYSGAGSSRGGAISLISSAGTPQDWIMATAGTDNSIVNGRSWFLYDNTSGVARFFVDKSSRVGVGLGTSAATSFVDIAAGTTAIGQLRLRAGVAPTTPNDGEIWFDGTDIKMQVGGVTKTFVLV